MDRPSPPPSESSPVPPAQLLPSRRFIVTGGARGIGAAVVVRLAAHGATGVILDLADDGTSPWPVVEVDVTDGVAVHVAVTDILRGGPVDGLVAAAGIVPSWHRPDDIDLSMLDKTLAVNLRGFVAVAKTVVPSMPAGSTIVAIGSLNSWRGDPNLLAYAASKHAVLGAVRSMAMSLGPHGIRVNAVAPGPVATEALMTRMKSRAADTGMDIDEALMSAAKLTSLGRIATPDDIADAVLFLSSPMSAAITGQLLPVDGGLL